MVLKKVKVLLGAANKLEQYLQAGVNVVAKIVPGANTVLAGTKFYPADNTTTVVLPAHLITATIRTLTTSNLN